MPGRGQQAGRAVGLGGVGWAEGVMQMPLVFVRGQQGAWGWVGLGRVWEV